MTIVYEITGSEFDENPGHCFYVETKKEALAIARQNRREGDEYAAVSKITLINAPIRQLACALLNSESYAAEVEDVAL